MVNPQFLGLHHQSALSENVVPYLIVRQSQMIPHGFGSQINHHGLIGRSVDYSFLMFFYFHSFLSR